MANSASVSVLPPQFDDFLFAQIGEDGNGMLLSVISAFARLDLDPWQEAANLAQLPKATAARRLASLMAKLPGLPLPQRDIAAVASRLISHLPRLAGPSPVVATKTLLGAGVNVRTAIRAYPFVYVWVILAVFMLGGLSIAASQLTAGHIDRSSPPAAGTNIPQAPPPTVVAR
jgi:hypothetical protein